MDTLLKRKGWLICLLIDMFPYMDFEHQLISALIEYYESATNATQTHVVAVTLELY